MGHTNWYGTATNWTTDAVGRLSEVIEGSTLRSDSKVTTARLMIAERINASRKCAHVFDLPQKPLVAVLEHRRVMCIGCLEATGVATLADVDNRCNTCNVVPADGMFHEVALQYDFLTALGNICTECHESHVRENGE